MKLRPHHLLCTQGYSGKGYSDAFVENMTALVTELRGEEPVEIELIFTTDDICIACPHKLEENHCQTNNKVISFDTKIINYFNLKEGTYIYQDLIKKINAKMTEEKMADICTGCSWYPISACRKNILSID